jgi:hypothetical protein
MKRSPSSAANWHHSLRACVRSSVCCTAACAAVRKSVTEKVSLTHHVHCLMPEGIYLGGEGEVWSPLASLGGTTSLLRCICLA